MSREDETGRPPLGVFLSPEGLAVLAAGVGTAVLSATPLVLVPGVLAYGIVTWFRLERWREAKRDARWRVVEPPLDGLTAANARRVVEAVRVERQILMEIAAAAPEHRALLASSAERVRELVAAAAESTRALQRIEEMLASRTVREVREPAERGNPAAELAARTNVAQEVAHREAMAQLQARAERYDAQLRGVQLALETTAAQVVRIKGAETGAASAESQRVAEALQALSIDVEALTEVVEDPVARYERGSA